MKIIKNHIIVGSSQKPILIDLFWKESPRPIPIVIFSHGYKGYKDWGAWELAAKSFAQAGFLFVKFNFSHNGGTKENPIDFPDLITFGKNTYTKELNDLLTVIKWVKTTPIIPPQKAAKNNITLIGHSRGGGVSLLAGNECQDITRVITWAAISTIANRFPQGEALKEWKKNGVRYVKNGRTLQEMPHEYGFYEDYLQNKDRLNILSATKNLGKKPLLIIHGEKDEAVGIDEAKALHQSHPSSVLQIIKDTGHTFGSKHPWKSDKLPTKLEEAITKSITFITSN